MGHNLNRQSPQLPPGAPAAKGKSLRVRVGELIALSKFDLGNPGDGWQWHLAYVETVDEDGLGTSCRLAGSARAIDIKDEKYYINTIQKPARKVAAAARLAALLRPNTNYWSNKQGLLDAIAEHENKDATP